MIDEGLRRRTRRLVEMMSLLAALGGCEGRSVLTRPPPIAEPEPDPRAVLAFAPLYGENCAGCHGARGEGGAALGLRAAGYLALVSDAELSAVIAEGRRRTAMPAFARSSGGMLSDAQVQAIVSGLRTWGPPSPPRARAAATNFEQAGDTARGAYLFADHCGSCHGNDGRGGARIGSIVDDAFVALTSEAGLRTTILVGRPELGCPGSAAEGPGLMSARDVNDTVEWLIAHRGPFPGRPYGSARAETRKQ